MTLITATLHVVCAGLHYAGSDGDKFAFIIAGQIAAGFAMATVMPIPPLIAATWFGEKEQATATSLAGCTNPLGIAFAFVYTTQMVPQSDNVNEVANGFKY